MARSGLEIDVDQLQLTNRQKDLKAAINALKSCMEKCMQHGFDLNGKAPQPILAHGHYLQDAILEELRKLDSEMVLECCKLSEEAIYFDVYLLSCQLANLFPDLPKR